MTYILYFLIPLAFFLLFNGTLVLVTKKEFGKCIPLSFILCALIMFASQAVFSTFSVGFYMLLLFAIISIPILLFYFFKKKELFKEFREKYFDKGLVGFLIIYIFFFILDLRRYFSAWDEFSHWGVMVKEMLRTDSFYSSIESTLLAHKDYPPIFQILELFWTKLCGNYYEPNLIKCIHIFEFSLFLPVIYKIQDKKKSISTIIYTSIYTLFLIIITFLSITIFDQHNVINTIYIDYLMALITAYAIYIILSEKDKLSYFLLFNLGMTMTFLVLLKQMGLPFYLIVIFVYVIDLFISRKDLNKNKRILKALFCIILLVILPLIEWKCWNIYVKDLNIEQQFSLSDVKITELPSILQGNSGKEYQTESGNNFLKAIISQDISSTNIHLSFVQAFTILLLLYLIFLFIYRKEFKKGEKLLIVSTLIIGAVGYLFVMLNMYVFSFGEWEGPTLASFDRYMDTYIILMVSLLIMLLFDKLQNSKAWLVFLIITILVILAQTPEKLNNIIPAIRSNIISEYELDAEKIATRLPEDAKVYILGVDDDSAKQYLIKYYSNPITTNVFYYKFDTNENTDPQAYINNIKHYILNYDYLYLKSVDEDFIEKYSFLFKDNIIIPGEIYTIQNINDKIELNIMN